MWSDITKSGEIAVSGLSLGTHYFVCSLPSHCPRGYMRIEVDVVKDGEQNEDETESDTEVRRITVFPRLDVALRIDATLE